MKGGGIGSLLLYDGIEKLLGFFLRDILSLKFVLHVRFNHGFCHKSVAYSYVSAVIQTLAKPVIERLRKTGPSTAGQDSLSSRTQSFQKKPNTFPLIG